MSGGASVQSQLSSENAAGEARLRPYPAYRNSGIQWLQTLPEHWTARRLKHIAAMRFSNVDKKTYEDEIPVRLCNYVDVYNNDFITSGIEFMNASASADEIRRFMLSKGDVLITKDSESWDDIAVPAHVNSELKGVLCGYHLAQVRANIDQLHSGYLFRAFTADGVRDQFMVAANGVTRFGLSKSSIGDAMFPVPPLPEQRAIAAFLDHETARIDELIAKKERLIELLQEKRTALISHAVTKGLNPDTPMKDSGIDWLGAIPDHWTVALFKHVAKTSYGVGGEIDRTLTEGTLTLSLPNIDIEGEMNVEDVPFAALSDDERHGILLRQGDLLFNWRNGSSKHLGKTAYFDLSGEYTHVSFLLRLRFDSSKHDSRYFHRLLGGLRITGFFSSSKAGVNNTFNQSELDNLWIMWPPLDEQRAIADYLDGEIIRVDAPVAKLQAVINRLREYRAALISAAVTGKIDVRERNRR